MFVSLYESRKHTSWTTEQKIRKHVSSFRASRILRDECVSESERMSRPWFRHDGLVTWVCLPATSLPYTDKKYVFININKHNYSNDTYLRNIDSENKKPVQMRRPATRATERGAARLSASPLFTEKINKKDIYKTRTGEQYTRGRSNLRVAAAAASPALVIVTPPPHFGNLY